MRYLSLSCEEQLTTRTQTGRSPLHTYTRDYLLKQRYALLHAVAVVLLHKFLVKLACGHHKNDRHDVLRGDLEHSEHSEQLGTFETCSQNT